MKKAYETPRLYFESFALSHSISSGCEGISNATEGTCSVIPKDWYDAGYMFEIFAVEYVCGETDPEYRNWFCYYAPDESNNVYSS